MPERKAKKSGSAWAGRFAKTAIVFCLAPLALGAPAAFATSVLLKCRDADGRVVLRDKGCRQGERELARTRPGEVTRQFTIIQPQPAAGSAGAGAASSSPPAGGSAPQTAKP
jgi:hypothetical protein